MTCSIDLETTDIDGDTFTYDYTWYDQDGNWASETLATTDLTNVYPATDTDVGTWTCEVVANDGDADSASTDAIYDDETCVDDAMLTFSGGNAGTCCCTGGNYGNSYILADVSPFATIEFCC